jgi:monoamine oxidase
MKWGHEVTLLEAAGRTGGHVYTLRDRLADDFYADAGAEHVTKPGYDLYWHYVKEFDLPTLFYPRRRNLLRLMEGKLYTEEMLADRSVLKGFGFNPREIDFLSRHAWWEFPLLYHSPYLDSFKDEYRPFDAGLNHLDEISLNELFKKDGASPAAIQYFGSSNSALEMLWRTAILKLRGVPLYPPELYRLRGGNQRLTDTFTTRLGDRVRLGAPVTSIEYGDTGVTVHYREFGKEKKVEADYLVSCMSLVQLRKIPVKPDWPEDKKYVIYQTPYYSESRLVFQSRSRFWEKDKISPNIYFHQPTLRAVWPMADELPTRRGLLLGNAVGAADPEAALAAFRKYYPGQYEDIEQVQVVAWPNDPWASACERVAFPGQLAKFWPKVMEPHGRIHFAGAYADNLQWGMEAATRSAHRVASIIDRA